MKIKRIFKVKIIFIPTKQRKSKTLGSNIGL